MSSLLSSRFSPARRATKTNVLRNLRHRFGGKNMRNKRKRQEKWFLWRCCCRCWFSALFLHIFICLMSGGGASSASTRRWVKNFSLMLLSEKNIILRSPLFLLLLFFIPNIFDVVIMPYLICFDDITREFGYYHLWDITCDTSNKIRLNEYRTFVESKLAAQPACIASGCSPLMKW